MSELLEQQAFQKASHFNKPVPLVPTRPRADSNEGLLSDREREVLALIVDGLSNTEIGQQPYLNPNIVKTYVKGIMNKLVVNDRVQAAVAAVRRGLVE